MPSCGVCPSVCPPVCHFRAFCGNEDPRTFSLSGSQTILVFPYQTLWRYSDVGVECRCGRQKSRFWRISGYRSMTAAVRPSTVQLSLPHSTQTVTHQWTFIYHSHHGRPRRREKNRIIRNRKSEAEVTCAGRIVLQKLTRPYWQARNIARPFCDSRATCNL